MSLYLTEEEKNIAVKSIIDSEIDEYWRPHLHKLNKIKGLCTLFCCQGHPDRKNYDKIPSLHLRVTEEFDKWLTNERMGEIAIRLSKECKMGEELSQVMGKSTHHVISKRIVSATAMNGTDFFEMQVLIQSWIGASSVGNVASILVEEFTKFEKESL